MSETISLDEIRQSLAADISSLENEGRFFKVQPAQKWLDDASKRPIPQQLFSEFWYESEICILFSDTNLGKSILAVQIADAVTTGNPISGFKMQAKPQPVLYFDFELSDKQLEARYSADYENHYPFDQGFLRAEINADDQDSTGSESNFEDFLIQELETELTHHKAKILIIDNLTYLKNDTEKARNALPLMQHLKRLKTKYDLSILVLAHTPKRDFSKPISRNDLGGSKMLINFCDSCFAIGESSQGSGLKYLKQIKSRNTEIIYDAENVCLCRIEKPSNFLQFEFVGYASEKDHLKEISARDIETRDQEILSLYESGKSKRAIARELNISDFTVRNRLKKMQDTDSA